MPETIQTPGLPEVEIVDQNGKAVDTSAIDNYDSFMAFLMQASIAANTVKIRKYFDDRTSVGEVQNFALQVTPIPEEVKCANPSQSIYVVNDGPGEIYVTINALGRTPTHLFVRDGMMVNFETHKLHQFYIWSAPGTVATARANVKY